MTVVRWLLVAALFVVAAPACKNKENTGRGSGVGSKVVRAIPPFKRLKVGGTIRAEVEVGSAPSLEILGDDNLLARVLSRLDGETLVVEPDAVLKPTQPLVARITTPLLEGVAVTVASSAIINGVRGERFQVSGTGGTRLTARGSTRALEVSARSAAQLDLSALSSAAAKVTAADGSRVELGHVETLDVTGSGPSVVLFRGDPAIEQKLTRPARLLRAR